MWNTIYNFIKTFLKEDKVLKDRTEVLALYNKSSIKASDVNRQLGFAGIGIIWLFRNSILISSAKEKFIIPEELFKPATLIIFSLGIDLLQYIIATAIWGITNRYLELNELEKEASGKFSRFSPIPILCLFWLKMIAMLFGYILIIIFIYNNIMFK
jgi:hypothetical protein